MKAVPLIGIARHRLTIDGEGVTTLVAFHGCPLRCKYCLSPCRRQPDGHVLQQQFQPALPRTVFPAAS